MNEIDKNNFKELMVGIGELYNKEFTKPLLRIYFSALQDLTIEQVEQGINGHINSLDKSGSFLPKPSDIRQVLFGSKKDVEQNIECKAELEWSAIEKQVSSVGSYGTPKIDNKQAQAVLSGMGGWVQLCASTVDQLTWKKKEFISMYKNIENTPLEMLPNNISGRVEIEQHKQEESNRFSGLMMGIKQR